MSHRFYFGSPDRPDRGWDGEFSRHRDSYSCSDRLGVVGVDIPFQREGTDRIEDPDNTSRSLFCEKYFNS